MTSPASKTSTRYSWTRYSWTIAGAAALAIFAGSAQAASSVPHATVRYAKRIDTTRLYARLQAASESVCRQHEGKELRNVIETRACYDQALSSAVAKVGDSALSTLHQAKREVRVAGGDTKSRSRG